MIDGIDISWACWRRIWTVELQAPLLYGINRRIDSFYANRFLPSCDYNPPRSALSAPQPAKVKRNMLWGALAPLHGGHWGRQGLQALEPLRKRSAGVFNGPGSTLPAPSPGTALLSQSLDLRYACRKVEVRPRTLLRVVHRLVILQVRLRASKAFRVMFSLWQANQVPGCALWNSAHRKTYVTLQLF